MISLHPATARRRIRARRRRRATRNPLRAGQHRDDAPDAAGTRARLAGGELSGGAPCQHRARRGFILRLLPRGAARRSEEPGAARTRIPLASWSTAKSTKRSSSPSASSRSTRPQRVARLVLGVRALKQKQYQAARQHIAQSVRGPIADLTATLITAWTLQGTSDTKGAIESIDRLTGPEWYAVFKDLHAGLILDVAGQQEGSRQAARAGLQARRECAARGRGLWPLGVAQSRQGRGAEGLRGLRQGAAAAPADHRGDGRDQGRREARPPGRLAAGRRGRSPVRARHLARPPGRRGSGARLSAARDLSRAAPSARADVAGRSLRVSSRSRRWRSRSISAFLRTRRSSATPISRWRPISMRSTAPRRRKKTLEKLIAERPERSRSHHGARQHPARAQGIRRVRRCLLQGHRVAEGSRRSPTG